MAAHLFDLLIVNGTVSTATDVGRYDIGIKGEKIALLAPTGTIPADSARRVLDAEGAYVTVRHTEFLQLPLDVGNN